jgi:hypothetical protein
MYKSLDYGQLINSVPYFKKFADTNLDKSEDLENILKFLEGIILNDEPTKRMYKFHQLFIGPPPMHKLNFIFKQTFDYDGPEKHDTPPPIGWEMNNKPPEIKVDDRDQGTPTGGNNASEMTQYCLGKPNC